jgi:predicted RNase H-like HicB family nuclease
MTEYTIIIEDAGSNFAAYAPDVPGCVATAKTFEETRTLMEEALELHLEMLHEMGEEIPEPNSQAATVRVAS